MRQGFGSSVVPSKGKGLQPCAYLNHKLALAETNIVLHTQELLEMIQALEVYRPCLKGATFKTN